jgi:hypothetical protein
MTNPWIEHIRKYAKENNISYSCAVSEAALTYTKKGDKKPEPAKITPAEIEAERIKKVNEASVKAFKQKKIDEAKKTPEQRAEEERIWEEKVALYDRQIKGIKRKDIAKIVKTKTRKLTALEILYNKTIEADKKGLKKPTLDEVVKNMKK